MPRFPSRELAEVVAKCRGRIPREKLTELAVRNSPPLEGKAVMVEVVILWCDGKVNAFPQIVQSRSSILEQYF